MSTTRVIYSAYDLETGQGAYLEHRFTPWGSWHTSTDHDDRREVMHDWLPDAAHRITEALKTFHAPDAPTPLQALQAIVKAIGDDHYTVEDSGDGPFILDWYDRELDWYEAEAEMEEDDE